MGQNKRYGSDLTWEAVNETLIRARPISLSPEEIGPRPPEAPQPIEVDAWVRFPETPIRVHGKAVAWTEKAVWVEFTLHNGQTHRAWVWVGAVTKRG